MPHDEDEFPKAAAAVVGGHATNLWARHAREDLQVSHTLTVPLVRWAPEPVEPLAPAPTEDVPADLLPEIVIPDAVVQPREARRLAEDAFCRSPIYGQVVAILAVAGQPVMQGQPVMVIEAMKMQNHVSAAMDGVLKTVHVSAGDPVKAGQLLFELV